MEGTREKSALPPFPSGWFAVGFSADLTSGDLAARRYFGRELVLFRTQGGAVGALDAHCPHLGAHLGHGGRIDGEALVCPFHGWRWGRDGGCLGMPYGSRIPRTARASAWPLREQNGVIFAFHDPARGEPDWEMPRLDDARWSAPVTMLRTVRSHPQEVLENTADFAHFRYVHQTHAVRATAGPFLEGPVFRLEIESDPEALIESDRSDSALVEGSAFCHGPGLAAATIVTKGSALRACQRLYATPIDGERLELRGMVNIERLQDPRETRAVLEALGKAVFEEWDADCEIWEHKRHRPAPALNDTEAAIPLFRRWYRQFYKGDGLQFFSSS